MVHPLQMENEKKGPILSFITPLHTWILLVNAFMYVQCGTLLTRFYGRSFDVPMHRDTKQQTRIENYIKYTPKKGTVGANSIRTRYIIKSTFLFLSHLLNLSSFNGIEIVFSSFHRNDFMISFEMCFCIPLSLVSILLNIKPLGIHLNNIQHNFIGGHTSHSRLY